MAYTSEHQELMPDEYMGGMEEYSLTNEILSPGFSTLFTNGETAFNFLEPGPASNNTLPTWDEQKDKMQSILDIFQLEEDLSEDRGASGLEESDTDRAVDINDQNRRTERLRGIRPALDRLWWAGSEHIAGAAEKLADGSRDPRWRIPMGESGILNSFLAIVATEGVQQSLMVHALRLIGNSCADTDENRERVVSQGYIPSVIALLKDISLLPFVIPVLFNICVDYEPAQQKASEAHLTKELIELISSPSFSESRAFLGYICKLLDLLITQSNEAELAPERTPAALLELAFDPEWNVDLEDFLALATSGIAYLRYERFQRAVVKSSAVQACFRIMLFSYTRFEDTTAHMLPPPEAVAPDQDDAKQLSLMRSSMNQVLSDISALPEFALSFPILSPFASNLRRCLSSPQLQLQVMACIMLGNIARSDSACEEFVHTCQIHKPLIAILTDATDSQLLHAAIGFLKNLALPLRNKLTLGDAGLLAVLPRLWNMNLPQIQYSSISLARQLLNSTFENVRRICHHLSEDRDSPAYQRTSLSILLDIFQRTEAEPIKMEIARLLTAICRVFTSPSQNIHDVEERRKQFFEYHPDVGLPLGFMVSQNKLPVLRSEGWFVMALMARTPEGSLCVCDIMHDVQVFQPLVELLTGKSIVDGWFISPSESPLGGGDQIKGMAATSLGSTKEAQMARIDRENALVLVSELLKHRGSSMASIRRSVFEELLKGGGLMHLSYQLVKEQEDFFDGKGEVPKIGLSLQEAKDVAIRDTMG